ncbi:ataxin-3 [Anabrus simplex]|uniref:ataxin-3 n=1 Tax=Anabrus simplex TaxID=316456 RepID=UPI0035A2655E
MEAIFHEKQEGSLCAQHCLNALLQGPYFTPVDLATLAQQMDDEERLRMSESGVDSDEYRRFIEQPSGNYDDSGYFSVQVISSALRVWGLELVPYNSTEPRALEAQKCPAEMQAFICNYRDHWFTIRRLGYQWFNLNSLLTGPELISDTYLVMFLAQLQQEGYSIFVVFGALPECDADSLLRLVPAVQTVKPRLITSAGQKLSNTTEEDKDLQKALRLSLTQVTEELPLTIMNNVVDEDEELQKALRMSLEADAHPASRVHEDERVDTEIQKALRLSITANNSQTSCSSTRTISPEDEEAQLEKALRLSLQDEAQIESDDRLELEKAMKMSLECCDSNSFVDTEEVRRRRLAYLAGTSSRHSSDLLPSTSKSVNT